MPRPVAIDLTRLFLAPLELSPQGIHRVELAFALHFLDHPSDLFLTVLSHPWGARWTIAERAKRGRSALQEIWGDTVDPAVDPNFRAVKARLAGAATDVRTLRHTPSPLQAASDFLKLIAATGFTLGRAAQTLPKDTIFINLGQFSLANKHCISWLGKRPDITAIFMLHDVIPLDYPELVPIDAISSRRKMIEHTVKFARAVITPSNAARELVQPYLDRAGGRNLPIFAEPLGVPDEFLKPSQPDPEIAETDYFLVCGRITQQKNQILLLNIWRELVQELGVKAPKLVLAGMRSHHSESATEMIERCELIRDHVIEASGLSTRAIAKLMAGARAVLMPSLVEGYGLPIVEALSQGTPVIASDIPAHREAGREFAIYLNSHDGPGWLNAIRGLIALNERPRISHYRPRTWRDYFREFETFLDSLDAARVPRRSTNETL